MARGFRESRKRDRKRRRLGALKWVFLALGLLALGWLAYAAGSELARGQVRSLEEQVFDLEADLSAITARTEELQTQLDETVAREQALREQIPVGKAQEIYALVGEQLAAGVKEERLLFLVRSAGEAVRCRNEPEQRRFIVQTGLTRGTNELAAFAGSAIVVRAAGEASRNANDQPEAWFDAAKPVTVTFTELSGAESETTGVLPLQHSVKLDGSEYRFLITPAPARGFLQVTADRCDLPEGG